MRPILIVSAFAPELAPLGRVIRSAAMKSSVVAVPVGIGLVEAGIGAARAIARFAPRLILFVGTAGSYAEVPPIGAVVIARRISLASGAVARREGYFPAPMPLWTAADPALRRRLLRAAGPDAAAVDVATPLAITRSGPLADRLAGATRTTVENLEAFAVARAAHGASIPFGVALGISNRVGPRAHAQWRRHQGAATLAACQVVEKFLATEITAPSRSPARARQPRPPG